MTESLGCRFFLSEVLRNQNTTEFSVRERERERWRRQLLRRWAQILVEICASEMADQNTGLEKLWITTKLALPAFVSCPDFSSRKSKPGIWKGWWIRTRVDLFFVFSSGILGETKQKKQKRQSRHIYWIRSWRSRILWNFYFPVSPLANFHQAMIFFSFHFIFFSPRIFFVSLFFLKIIRTDSSQNP